MRELYHVLIEIGESISNCESEEVYLIAVYTGAVVLVERAVLSISRTGTFKGRI